MAVPKWKDIFEAVANGDLDAVKFFVEVKGISVESVNAEQETLAHIAAENTRLNVLKYVLGKAPSLLKRRDVYNNTVLYHAVVKGFLPLVKYLVDELNADIYEPINTSLGNTAIHEAVEEGRIDVLKYFIQDKKVDADTRNKVGEPLLFIAAAKVRLPIVEYLVEKANATVTLTDHSNNTILDVSAKIGDVSVPRYLLDTRKINLDINQASNNGRTLVYLASRHNHLALLKYLIEEKHADINICDEFGRSPLHSAAGQGHLRIVKFLLKHGADPEIKDTFGRTAMDASNSANVTQYLDEIMYPPPRSKRSTPWSFRDIPNFVMESPSGQYALPNSQRVISSLGAENMLRFDHYLLLAAVTTWCGRKLRRMRNSQQSPYFPDYTREEQNPYDIKWNNFS